MNLARRKDQSGFVIPSSICRLKKASQPANPRTKKFNSRLVAPTQTRQEALRRIGGSIVTEVSRLLILWAEFNLHRLEHEGFVMYDVTVYGDSSFHGSRMLSPIDQSTDAP
jgi:hypothetical protein